MRTKKLRGSIGIDRKVASLRFRTNWWISWILALAFVLSAVLAQGDRLRYRYVSLDDKAPPGFAFFFASGINDSGRVYGTATDATFTNSRVAFYENGAVTVVPPSNFNLFTGPVNEDGTVGGFVLLDPVNFIFQAALFHEGEAELIPRQPGELQASVVGLNDSGTTLVESFTASARTDVLYSKGQATPIDFGLALTPRFFSSKVINNKGVIAGTSDNLFNHSQGFRFDTRTGKLQLLDPVAPDTEAWGVAINNRGGVLGYSFVTRAPYHERIGVWNRKGLFKTYIDETIVSNRLLFNDHNLIVITLLHDGKSYLVPKPGVRLNLADLVENLPFGEHLVDIFDMNNHGDLLGTDFQHTFLLKRIGGEEEEEEEGDD